MPFEISMPQLGLTMETGTIVEWLVGEGETFAQGQEIYQVETDKSIVAVEAREAGALARVIVPAGQQVAVGTVLAVAVTDGESLPDSWQPAQPATATLADECGLISPVAPKRTAPADVGALSASWKARAMAKEAGLDLNSVVGTGLGGRIVAEDVTSAMAVGKPAVPTRLQKMTPVAARLVETLGLHVTQLTGSGRKGEITQADVLEAAARIIREPEVIQRPAHKVAGAVSGPGLSQPADTIPLQGVRKIVSEGMATSSHDTARVTLFREVDAGDFVRLRERFRSSDVDCSYNDILIYICAAALREHPEANARLGDGQIELLDSVNVGLAVDTGRGLLVPVIHSVQSLTLSQIISERARLVEAARRGHILPDDLTGGTFTITNLGMYGVEGFTPIINLPECCILGLGKIVRKPVVSGQDDAVLVRPMMMLSLVFDHRVIDGAAAARFLDRIASLVEHPVLLLTDAESRIPDPESRNHIPSTRSKDD